MPTISGQTAIFIFIATMFLAILIITAGLTLAGRIDGQLFGQVAVAEVAAVAGLLAPSPIQQKPPTP